VSDELPIVRRLRVMEGLETEIAADLITELVAALEAIIHSDMAAFAEDEGRVVLELETARAAIQKARK
jgi:hypothetical protein